MNQSILTGNLGNDPEVFFSGDGDPIASFNLAFRSSHKKKDTSWIKVTAFNKLAEICQTYLHKGARIAISGILQQEKWETEGGEKRSTFKLIANNIEFIKTDGRGFEEGQESDDVPF